jgi:hypothetical protein
LSDGVSDQVEEKERSGEMAEPLCATFNSDNDEKHVIDPSEEQRRNNQPELTEDGAVLLLMQICPGIFEDECAPRPERCEVLAK